ncbi:MAG: fluoride efflux transporter CrcB [Sphingomonas sp.]|nr:fluoride efflux transporter CrcB [Sphingomonas sp.]
MPHLLLVMIGGALGAGARYEVGRWTLRHLATPYPWGTLTVNLVGGLLMGLLAGFFFGRNPADQTLWLFLGVGVLGGFTTFSAFSFDMFAMIERGQWAGAASYALVSVIGALALFFLGFWLARLAA